MLAKVTLSTLLEQEATELTELSRLAFSVSSCSKKVHRGSEYGLQVDSSRFYLVHFSSLCIFSLHDLWLKFFHNFSE